MNLVSLTIANIRFKPLNAVFNVLLLAIGITTILTLAHLERQLNDRFARDLHGIDLVVSGKGSPLQIILSTVFHLDIPTGNIPVTEADALSRNPLVKSAIPLALGDNYNGYRIVGTTPAYIEHYSGHIAQGKIFSDEMDVVIGSDIARTHHLRVGDKIVGAHGLVNSEDLHSDFPYTVTGILAPTGSVLDRLVITPLESVWHVHEHPDEDDPDEVMHKHDHPENEYTALLLTYRSPLAAAQLPRLINETGALQAASPAFEVARLHKLMGTGTDILSLFGGLLIGFAAFGFFATLSTAIHDRLGDLALLRTLGASRAKVFGLIISEALLLGVSGSVFGFMLSQIALKLIAIYINATQHLVLVPPEIGMIDAGVLLAGLFLSLVAAILPAIRAYRLNLTATLRRL